MTVLSFLGITIYLYITWYQPVSDISPGAWTALYACLGDARSAFMGWFPVAILAWDIRDTYIYIICIYILYIQNKYANIIFSQHPLKIGKPFIHRSNTQPFEPWMGLENRLVNSAINIQPIDS